MFVAIDPYYGVGHFHHAKFVQVHSKSNEILSEFGHILQ